MPNIGDHVRVTPFVHYAPDQAPAPFNGVVVAEARDSAQLIVDRGPDVATFFAFPQECRVRRVRNLVARLTGR